MLFLPQIRNLELGLNLVLACGSFAVGDRGPLKTQADITG